jgi:hypothetical protein
MRGPLCEQGRRAVGCALTLALLGAVGSACTSSDKGAPAPVVATPHGVDLTAIDPAIAPGDESCTRRPVR